MSSALTPVPARQASDAEKAGVRTTVFTHLSGIVLAPTVRALFDRGVFQMIEESAGPVPFEDIEQHTRGNRGYLRVALRLLAAAGWLEIQSAASGSTQYTLTARGRFAFEVAPGVYGEGVSFIPKALFLQDFLYSSADDALLPSIIEMVGRAKLRWGLRLPDHPVAAKEYERIIGHMDGLIAGPAMVALARGGVFAELEKGPADLYSLKGKTAALRAIFEMLEVIGWVTLEGDRVQLTACGRYAAQIATSYGVTVSYLPTMNSLSTLLFGNARIPRFDESGVESLVDRAMNVWGSGGAHTTYFKKIDEIVVEIFNAPLDKQPRGICDMGCGDGTLLAHLYEVVKTRTERGKNLATHPLAIVGADFNKVARRVTKQTLRRARIPNYQVIHGDINRPAQLAGDMEKLGFDAHDFLHVRSFLDHNRPYSPPSGYVPGSRKARSQGAFAHLGEEITADALEENLVRHLKRWAPYIGRFGLLVLELHTLPPTLTAANLDRTPAVAYDGTHGYSDQYLVELPIFLECAREAGLVADPRYQAKFPPSDLATVSINVFAAPQA
jgi:SAM-dependent methyltransferase